MSEKITKTDVAVLYVPKRDQDQCRMVIMQHVAAIGAMKWKIPPWLEPTFWCNMRSSLFAQVFASSLLQLLRTADKETQEKAKLTLCFLQTNYSGCFDVYQLQGTAIPGEEVAQLISDLLQMKMTTDSLLKSVVHHYRVPSLSRCGMFSFTSLLRHLRRSPDGFHEFIIASSEAFKYAESRDHEIRLLHVLRVIMTLFHGLDDSLWRNLRPRVQQLLGKGDPVSTMAYQFGVDVEREVQLPGAMYYELLEETTNFNAPLHGSCPCIFDENASLVPSLLYSCTNDQFPLTILYCNFARYCLVNFGRNSGDRLEDLSRFCQMFSLNPDDIRKVKQYFGLSAQPRRQSQQPRPDIPVIPVVTRQFLTSFDIAQAQLQPYMGQTYIFQTSLDIILRQSIFAPASEYMAANGPDNCGLKLLFIGGDWLLGNFLLSYISNIWTQRVYAGFSPTIYLIPNGRCLIGDFLMANDPIYRHFVGSLGYITQNVMPTLDEVEYAHLMPSVVEKDDTDIDSHLWYSYPSPSHVFQIGIQHFLHFAKETVPVLVWKCRIKMLNDTQMVIPFITSVRIETDAKKGVRCACVGPDRKSEIVTLAKVKKVQFWNANTEHKMAPTDPFLLMESEERMGLVMHTAVIAERPLAVAVDERSYGNAKEIVIERFDDFASKDEMKQQLKIMLATFVPMSM